MKKAAKLVARHTGVSVFAVTAALLACGWLAADLDGASPAMALAYPLVVGVFCGVCAIRKWKAWLIATLLGMLIGAISAVQIFVGPRFPGQYRIAFLTLFVYTALAAIIGAVAELIRFLHRLTHDLTTKIPRGKK